MYTPAVMEDFTIREAAPSEQKILEDLQLRASLTNAGDREAILAHPDAIALPMEQITAGDVFVWESGGVITGFAAIQSRPDGNTELDGLFVDPGIRRRGIGRALVEHCVQIAKMRGSNSLCVVGNPHAKDFYASCGFSVIGTSETRFGSGLLMQRPLAP
jgi:ribosomal protein S18 acetylase RimI-like enzyme